MSMYNDYDFDVEPVHPSGMIQYQSGKATSIRKFKVLCEFAEEFALRLIGKYFAYDPEDVETVLYDSPVLPSPFPFDGTSALNYGRVNLVATSFSIEPISDCCFKVRYTTEETGSERQTKVTDPTSLNQMEAYFAKTTEESGQTQDDIDEENAECFCMVSITYEENPCDCVAFNNTDKEWEAHPFVLPNTCLSVERNPSYEMFTLPNGGLSWEGLPSGSAERQLKPDSYAYKIIPKADIIVHWHNVPLRHLCAIENHLREFRGSVNSVPFGDAINCDAAAVNPAACGCGQYEPETILFIDFQEDRSKRTDAFGGFSGSIGDGFSAKNMNTTTLKLIFKQKRIEKPTSASYSDSDDCPDDNDEAYGWNHLFLDREGPVDGTGDWMRVVVEATGDPLFPLKSFNTIFYSLL
jgi:hypothetical protein